VASEQTRTHSCLFWYTLQENEDVGGFALTRKNKTTLQTTYLPAYHTYRDLAYPQ